MTEPIRVAIVGTGGIARVHARALGGQDGATGPAAARRTMALVAGIYAAAFTLRPVTPDDLAPGTAFHHEMNGGNPGW